MDGFLEAIPVDDPSWVMVVDGIVLLILLETETFRAAAVDGFLQLEAVCVAR